MAHITIIMNQHKTFSQQFIRPPQNRFRDPDTQEHYFKTPVSDFKFFFKKKAKFVFALEHLTGVSIKNYV